MYAYFLSVDLGQVFLSSNICFLKNCNVAFSNTTKAIVNTYEHITIYTIVKAQGIILYIKLITEHFKRTSKLCHAG